MSERERYVVRREHKLTGQSYVAGVRDDRGGSADEAGGPHVRCLVSVYPSPETIEVVE
jgi:hypothetical protein